jgi:putative hemolysin
MNNVLLEIAAILVLIAANGFFSLSEFSIIASRRSRLKRLAKEGNRSAERAYKIHSRPENFLATVQVGITFVGVMAGVFSGMTIVNYVIPLIAELPVDFIARSARPVSSIIVALLITFTAVVLGELVPKYLALYRPEKIAAAVSGPISVFIRLGFFLVKILTATARFFMKMLGVKYGADRSAYTEEEINLLIAEGFEKGVFDATEKQLIHSVFDFSDTTARQAMTPRTDIKGIDISDSTDRILEMVTTYGFSRYPVYEKTMDKIVGIIYTKDVVRVLQHRELIVINDILRRPLFVPDSMMLNILLKVFQQKKVHIAMVLDEFGGTAGLITLEDLLEEIVGDIQDEFDTEQREFVQKSTRTAFVAGSLRIDDLNDRFDTDLPEGGVDTVGGLVFEQLGRPAVKGEEIIVGELKFRVLELDGNRLKRLRVEKMRPHNED